MTNVGESPIAIVAPNYYPRTCGIGDHSMRLAQELGRQGARAVVVTCGTAEANPEAPDVQVFSVAATSAHARALALALRDKIRELGAPFVVVQYTAQAYGSTPRFGSAVVPWLAACLRRDGVKVACIIHELFVSWRARPDVAVAAAVQRVQLMAVLRSVHHAWVTTETRRDSIRTVARYVRGADDLGILRIGPGVVPRAASPHEGGPRVGVFSTLAAGRRFDVVIDAFELVARSIPDAELVLLGDLGDASSEPYRRLRARLARSPSLARTRAPGRSTLTELGRQIAELDLFLFPAESGANTRSSTLPVAFGSGVPVVATKGSETDDIFKHDENVWFASKLEADAFAEAMLLLLRDEPRRARLARGGLSLFDQYLRWPLAARSVLEARC